MAKEVNVKLVDVCQVCKFHKNKPSRCVKQDIFVGRKQEKCEFYKQKQKLMRLSGTWETDIKQVFRLSPPKNKKRPQSLTRVSYNDYYDRFPPFRWEFDSLYPLHLTKGMI